MRRVDMEPFQKFDDSDDTKYHDTIPAPPSGCYIDPPKIEPLSDLSKWASGDVIVLEDDDEQ
jgi:hypothetical protein